MPPMNRLLLALGVLAGLSVGAQAQQRAATAARTRSTGPVRASVRFTPSPQGRRSTPLSPQQRAAQFQDLSGIVVVAASLVEPVRMTSNYPSHAGGLVTVTVEGAVTVAGKDVNDHGYWILRTTPLDTDVWESQLSLSIEPSLLIRPILVDCDVQMGAEVTLRISQDAGPSQVLTLPNGTGHILAVVEQRAGKSGASFVIKLTNPKHNMYVHYCELTALK